MKGIYTYVIKVEKNMCIEVGALGMKEFTEGWYAYTGSAMGPGGFKRVDRHLGVAEGENDARQWHIDYLNGCEKTNPVSVVKSRSRSECNVAHNIKGEFIPGFGSSDCDCNSHLTRSENNLLDTVIEAHAVVSDDVYVEHF